MNRYIPLTPGTLLQTGRYEVLESIGQGGMGAVYKARHIALNKEVAIKETTRADAYLQEALEREARRLARLKRHEALPAVIDAFTEEVELKIISGSRTGVFFVMEYVPGSNLEELLGLQSGPFQLDVVLVWGDQLLDALSYLHGLSDPIIHKDIKPSNLKLTEGNQIILLDFGLSKSMDEGTLVHGTSKFYSSLEQIKRNETDARSDLYSLAATLYHLMTGVAPPDAEDREAALRDGQPDPLQPAPVYNSQVTPAVMSQIAKAMALNRDYRHGSAEEMRRVLKDSWLHNTPADISELTTAPIIDNGRSDLTKDDEKLNISPAAAESGDFETAILKVGTTLISHTSTIKCITFSPDNVLLAGGCDNGDIGIWKADSGNWKNVYKGPTAAVTCLAFSPDGKSLACTRMNNGIELWDVKSKELKWKFKAHGLEVHTVSFSPDGTKIVWGELGKPPAKVQLWNITALRFLQSLNGNGHFLVKSLSFSPCGERLACALWARDVRIPPDHQGQIQIWDMGAGKVSLFAKELRVNAVSFSPAGEMLACGCVDKAVRLFDVRSGRLRRILAGHRNKVSSIAFSPDGNILASSDYDELSKIPGDVRLWDTRSGLLMRRSEEFMDGVNSVSFSNDGKTLAFAAGKIIKLAEIY
jgi:eukaryotic-like serine/threonine-protein kinase